jgi:hypothetical protein
MFMSEKGKYLHIILDMGDIVEDRILGVGGFARTFKKLYCIAVVTQKDCIMYKKQNLEQ